jgi:hypothetical protein
MENQTHQTTATAVRPFRINVPEEDLVELVRIGYQNQGVPRPIISPQIFIGFPSLPQAEFATTPRLLTAYKTLHAQFYAGTFSEGHLLHNVQVYEKKHLNAYRLHWKS